MAVDGYYRRDDGSVIDGFDELCGMLSRKSVIERTARQIVSGTLNEYDLQDLTQYVFLTLCEKREKVMAMQMEGKLKFFIWGVLTRQLNSNSSQFTGKIRQPRVVLVAQINDGEGDDEEAED